MGCYIRNDGKVFTISSRGQYGFKIYHRRVKNIEEFITANTRGLFREMLLKDYKRRNKKLPALYNGKRDLIVKLSMHFNKQELLIDGLHIFAILKKRGGKLRKIYLAAFDAVDLFIIKEGFVAPLSENEFKRTATVFNGTKDIVSLVADLVTDSILRERIGEHIEKLQEKPVWYDISIIRDDMRISIGVASRYSTFACNYEYMIINHKKFPWMYILKEEEIKEVLRILTGSDFREPLKRFVLRKMLSGAEDTINVKIMQLPIRDTRYRRLVLEDLYNKKRDKDWVRGKALDIIFKQGYNIEAIRYNEILLDTETYFSTFVHKMLYS